MLRRIGIALLTIAGAAAAADKPNLDNQIKELQRDVAQLQEMVKTLQASFEQRVAAVASQVQGVEASVEKVNTSVAMVAKGVEQVGQVGPVVAAQGRRIEQANEALNTVQQAVADLTAAVNRMQTQMVDVNNSVKALAATPVPPPGSDKPSAADLINNAQGDQSGGKWQLALAEYGDYLKYYGDTPMANVAQFQIGVLHYQLKEYDRAVEAFDVLVQKYPESTKAPDALLLKRKSLQALGKAAEAAAVCQELRQRFAGSEQAKQCAAPRR
jgi:TolA-binding protein